MGPTREIGIVGLGRMGSGLALQAIEKGFRVVGNDRHPPAEKLADAGLIFCDRMTDLVAELSQPRKILLYVPAGKTVDSVLESLTLHLEPGDVVADGGNSYWGDSLRRYGELIERDVSFVDVGTSGGPEGARSGACFMAGGSERAVGILEPVFHALSVEGGFVHTGGPGTGHFVKLVHNGIEFGMLQAIGEGIDLLEHFDQKLDVAAILQCWRNGTVIRSWLIDLIERHYRECGGLSSVPSYVEDTGEVNWLIGDALRMERSVPVMAQAVMQLLASRDRSGTAAKAVAAMRHEFGGHPFGADEAIKRERQNGRLGKIWQPSAED